jgi:hypothetical protein
VKMEPPADGSVNTYFSVKKTSQIQKLSVVVYGLDNRIIDSKAALTLTDFGDTSIGNAALKIASGKNIIRVINPDQPTQEVFAEVTCSANCSTADASPKPAQAGTVHINSPAKRSSDVYNQKTVPLGVRLDPASTVTQVKVKVVNNDVVVPQQTDTFTMPDSSTSPRDKGIDLKIADGLNKITVFDPANPDTQRDYVEISCENCNAAPKTVSITVVSPAPGTFDSSFRDAYLSVAKSSNIQKIKYYVLHNGTSVVTPQDVEAVDVKYDGEKPGTVVVPIKFVEGDNTITFFDADHPDDSTHQASLSLKCAGVKCAHDFLLATITTNSMNTRVIVGMEQVGASSASSETKPFIDFFFTNGLKFDKLKDKVKNDGSYLKGPDEKPILVPRFGTWGQVRLSTTPEQTASASVFPSNFVNQVTDPSKVVNLVQSFDFLGGVEFRAASADGWNWTLIPGVRQKSRMFFTFGGGAISPLNAARASAQIFSIPAAADTVAKTPASPQRDQFIQRFGTPPDGKLYVGFVPLERDRFLRQYYFGLRFKTHYCEDAECTRFKNSFPSIVDFAVGQNEAVTGGRFSEDGKRFWVMRLDVFYPLPFREANFLYLYGTALMKFGGGGPRVDVPLFLDVAPGTVQITDTSVFIPGPKQQPSQINRDYYKIGIGVNLNDLFNRNKTPPH